VHINGITGAIIGAALRVHRELGPGLLESTYEKCLVVELLELGLPFERQKWLSFTYKGTPINRVYRVDLIVDASVIVEIKSIAQLTEIHRAQLITYLKHSGCQAGLLINFNEVLLKNGIRRVIHNLPKSLLLTPRAPCPP
jgi:GxxExxY protein